MDARLFKRKNVKIKSGEDEGDGVDIPVISALPFTGTNGQIFNYRVVNDSSNTSREVTTKKVHPSHVSGVDEDTKINYDESISIEVERVQVADIVGTNGQIFKHRFQNHDPAPRTPEAAAGIEEDELGHYAVHYIRYYKDNDDTEATWIDVEAIDRLRIVGTNGQIFNYRFKWPTQKELSELDPAPSGRNYGDKITDDDDPYKPYLGYCDPTLELMPPEEQGSSIDPPWRLDPFQNIVNLGGGYYVIFFWRWQDWVVGGINDYQWFPSSGIVLDGHAWQGPPGQGSGTDGHGETNGTSVDMLGDQEDPLSSGLLNGTDRNSDGTSEPPDVQTTVENYPIGHITHVEECGYGFNDAFVEAARACPGNPPPNASGTTFPRKSYYLPYLFAAAPTKPPEEDSDNFDDYVPKTYKEVVDGVNLSVDYSYTFTSVDTIKIDEDTGLLVPNSVTLAQFLDANNGISPLVDVYVFSTADVELKLEDKFWPLRKKGDTTVYPDTVQGINDRVSATAAKARCQTSITRMSYQNGVFPSGSQDLSVWENGVEFEWQFELLKFKYLTDPEKSIPMIWPVSPAARNFTATRRDQEGNENSVELKLGQYAISVHDPDVKVEGLNLIGANYNIGDPPTGDVVALTQT